jgi:hypothetical protein
MNQVSLDSQEMVSFLQHIIENNRELQKLGLNPVATEVIGESGLGKTSIALQMAKNLGIDCVKLNLAQIEELGDLVGFPLRQFQLCKGGGQKKTKSVMKKVKLPNGMEVMKKVDVEVESDSECIWVDENAIDEYLKQGYAFTGEKRMSYCPPEWIADKKKGGILILDDWNRADIRFIQAVMELVDRQEYISWKLPKDWHILLTANPDNGDYIVNSIDTAQRTRFVSVVLKWNHERWAEWAEKQNIDGRCINFVLMNPEVVNTKVNPRSLTTFFNCIRSIKNFDSAESLTKIQMIGEGSVGPETASLFTSFINNKLDKLLTPQEMLEKYTNDVIIDKLNAAVYPDDPNKYRADIANVLALRFINYTVNYSTKNKVTDDMLKRIIHLLTNDLFTYDIRYHIVKKLIASGHKFQKLLINTEVQSMATWTGS